MENFWGDRWDNFNPRSPWGERPNVVKAVIKSMGFQSTLPVGGATAAQELSAIETLFQSTLPVGGATGGQGCASEDL